MKAYLSIALSLLIMLSCELAQAHAFTPAAVLIEETAPLHYSLTFRRSSQFASTLALSLPSSCRERGRTSAQEGDQTIDRFQLQCPTAMQGQTLRVLGLAELSIGAVVHGQFLDGRTVRELLSAQRMSVTIPDEPWLLEVFLAYLTLGIRHLLTGLDHVLFVVGLLCLVSGLRNVFWALTAFTAGHSVTLCLSALSILKLAQPPVELGIALSLLVVALEIALSSNRSAISSLPARARMRPWLIASAFGLLHGLGFASALTELGLPEDDIPLSLFAFNLGVELGQVLVVCATLPLLWTLSILRTRERIWRLSAAYLIGSLSGMWCIERVLLWIA